MINIPKGTKDVLPFDAYKWHYIEKAVRSVADKFNILEVRTPVFEHTELFLRGVGQTTDVVTKEMYTFLDKGDRSITLKPEGTAGVARCYIENSLAGQPQPTKMYYITPVFRYERPQAGRLREHHQFGVEMYGSSSASIDAEVISVANSIFEQLNVSGLTLNVNSIGCPTCRAVYNSELKKFFEGSRDKLCPTCLERMEKNPLRLLDCKEEGCIAINKNAPVMLDYLCEDCSTHFAQLKHNLTVLGIEYKIDPRIVRGLDYYTKTVFEFVSETIGAKGTVCGGGRYDGLIESLGGKPTSGVGFGMGLERLLLQMAAAGIEIENTETVTAFVVSCDSSAFDYCFKLTNDLRSVGISADIDHTGRSMKAQIKYADKLGARFMIIVGEDEMNNNKVTIKNMSTRNQETIDRANLFGFINKEIELWRN